MSCKLRISTRCNNNGWIKIVLPVFTIVWVKLHCISLLPERKSQGHSEKTRAFWRGKVKTVLSSQVSDAFLLVYTLHPSSSFLEKSTPNMSSSDAFSYIVCSVPFSSVTQSCLTLCNPMDCSTPGFTVHHWLPELTLTHVHQVSDAMQPSHPLSSLSSLAFNLSQHKGLFEWVSSSHQVAKVLEFQLQHQSFQWIFRTDFL